VQISDWLMGQAMPRQQLVLIGASAGWMLPTALLAQIKEIRTWDIVPWTKPLLYVRHGRHLKRLSKALHLLTGDGLALLPELVRCMPRTFSGLTMCWAIALQGLATARGLAPIGPHTALNEERGLGQFARPHVSPPPVA